MLSSCFGSVAENPGDLIFGRFYSLFFFLLKTSAQKGISDGPHLHHRMDYITEHDVQQNVISFGLSNRLRGILV